MTVGGDHVKVLSDVGVSDVLYVLQTGFRIAGIFPWN